MLSVLLRNLMKQLPSVFGKRKRKKKKPAWPVTSLPITVDRPEALTALATFSAEASPICGLEVALPIFAFEEAPTVDGAKSEEVVMCVSKQQNNKVLALEGASERGTMSISKQEREIVFALETAMKFLNDAINKDPFLNEIITERNNVLELIEAKAATLMEMEIEMEKQKSMIQENNKLIDQLQLYTSQMEGSVV
ncbi:uncharacterized protein [Dysidea avara]|uniref:uncharacterized protein n=1 Tax=Dysidea avara TaxID=196820 RepID=UPI00332CD6F0